MHKGSSEQSSKWFLQFASLRARLLVLLILTLLPVYGFILYTAHQVRLQSEANSEGDAYALTRLTVVEQDELIDIIRQQLLDFAQFPVVLNAKLASQCSGTFAQLLKLHPLYNNLGVINPDGTLRCSAVPAKGGLNFSDRGYFRAAMATHDFSIGDYLIDRVTGKSSLNLAYPILDEARRTRAVVFVALSLGALSAKLIATSVLPPDSTIEIVDSHGMVLARQPDPGSWVGHAQPGAAAIRPMLEHKAAGSFAGKGLDGVERLYEYAPLNTARANPVYVEVGIPTAAVYADAQVHFAHALILMALVTVLVIAMGWFGSRSLLLQPMALLLGATRRLGQGDLGARTGLPHRADEFGRLAHSLDEMASSLQERQSRIARAETRFTNIIDLSEDAIISVDEEQRILIFSQGAEKIFGYTTKEMLGQPLERLLPERHRAAHIGHIRQFATEAVSIRDMNRRPEISGLRKDGSEFFAQARISRLIEDGKPVFTVYLRDITERKNAENAIHKLNAELERKVIERTTELQSTNRELEAFSYSVSHDLRAPLRAIDGFSQALLEDYAERLDDQARDHLGRVRGATQRMGFLIDDMLTLSRITRAEMRNETVDLSSLAAEVFAELQKSEPERKVDWRIESGLAATGDAKLLRVLLVNLLGNAWKYTGKTINAKIEFGATRSADGSSEFFVRDNGAGFDMAYVGKLFGAFQRLHLASEFPGTGVGLATVQRIIHRHGGRVRGEGVPDLGATFYFTLPG